MKYTCDLLDQACTDRMALYQGISILIVILVMAFFWWWDKHEKKRRENVLESYMDCCDNCTLAYKTFDHELRGCYLRCARRIFQ